MIMQTVFSYIIFIFQLFWPHHLFKDCNKGKPFEKILAIQHNQKNAHHLLDSILNAFILNNFSFSFMFLAEFYFKNNHSYFLLMFIVFFSILFIFAIISIVLNFISYIFLSSPKYFKFN